MKEMLYEVRYLKSNEDMILALAGQFLSNCLMNLKFLSYDFILSFIRHSFHGKT